MSTYPRLMIIFGIITFIVSILFWCVMIFGGNHSPPRTLCNLTRMFFSLPRFAFFRFFFPDSPATARFLTPEERVLAVERIKVNQAGLENKHWKKEQ